MDISQRLIITEPMYFTEPCTKCGYCKGQKPNRESYYALESWFLHDSHAKTPEEDTRSDDPEVKSCTVGFQAENMTVQMYDKLCNMGFRRSGKFIYKPDLLRSCCRLYTIRTKPDEVQISKEFKSCIKKFGKFINGTSRQGNTGKRKSFDYIQELLDRELTSDRFHTKFEPSVYTDEKYELFCRYQECVHKDFKHTRSGFKRFLCDSPFTDSIKMGTEEEWEELNNWKNETYNLNGRSVRRLGPAHECYYFDDKLIAIAVTDFLPSGISSVYFIWDPDFSKWSLGKVSALRELTLLSKIGRSYYYLGYYIEDCHKMNYKGAYGGELLDVCNSKYAKLEFLQDRDMISLGRLFVTWNGNAREVTRELPLNDKLEGSFPSIATGPETVNIAERLYGTDGIAFSREKMTGIIKELRKFGVYYPKNVDSVVLTAERGLNRCETFTEHFNDNESEDSKSSSSSEESAYASGSDGEEEDDLHKIPGIFPGALPMWELLELIRTRRIHELDGKFMFFDTGYFCFRPLLDFDGQASDKKLLICNIVRLLGLELAKSVVVVV